MPQSKEQKETMERVMHEFQHGELETSRGKKVKNPKQAIAIGLRAAGASKYESEEENRGNLKRTKQRERRGETAKDEAEGKEQKSSEQSKSDLYAKAKTRNIPGRSKMSKDELKHALKSES